MKIRKLTPENYDKATALLGLAFPSRTYEIQVVEKLRQSDKEVHEWVCIHTNRVVGYIAFSSAYQDSTICGLHLAPLAVKPDFQGQGIGSELLNFALRQAVIKESSIFVVGDPQFFEKFGFEPCAMPVSSFETKKSKLLSLRNNTESPFTVGYEAAFNIPIKKVKPAPARKPAAKKRRRR